MKRHKSSTTIFLIFFIEIAFGENFNGYREKISFFAYSNVNKAGSMLNSSDTSWTSVNCEQSKNFTFIVHGWAESRRRHWVSAVVRNFLKLRGNCVFFVDYSKFAGLWYFALRQHFDGISQLLSEKVTEIAGKESPARVTMFGFSFGARLVIDAGLTLAKLGAKVGTIYACDPAGPGFEDFGKSARNAAAFVQCIHTSNTLGTAVYDCHQNWRLGVCGQSQPGARFYPFGSHGLCPYIFAASFSHDFFQNNFYNCSTSRSAANLPKDLILGPRETRLSFQGDIFAPTAKNPPWVVTNGQIENKPAKFPSAKMLSDLRDEFLEFAAQA